MSASGLFTALSSHRLADFTNPMLMLPCLRGQDAASVIQELAAALQREGGVPDLLQFYHAALNREYLCSTAAEPGWALPHAQVKFLERPCFAVGRAAAPMRWVAQSGQRVEMVFLFAIPETDARGYTALISGLACLSKDHLLLESFLKASDSFQMFEVLRQVKLRAYPAAA